ncbi:MAG: alcohol dehydrogenase, partial [Proteobacteria bacterium]|nr:alcohol dehydrogenase [Pseudomonadota bacterium]
HALERHFEELGESVRLRSVLPDQECLPEICEDAAHDVCMLTNPRPATAEDLLAICEEAW